MPELPLADFDCCERAAVDYLILLTEEGCKPVMQPTFHKPLKARLSWQHQ